MRSRLFPDSRGASPIIGNLLLVGIVVILGAVLSVLALSFLSGVGAPPPQTDFDAAFTESGEVTVTHVVGDAIVPSQLSLVVDERSGTTRQTWATLSGASDDVTAGDAATLSGLNGDETVQIVWNSNDGERSSILRTFETRGIDAPAASARVSAPSPGKFASQTSGWEGTAWQAVARSGGSGGSQVRVTESTSVSGDSTTHNWQNGQATPFTLTYDQGGNGEATLSVDGSTVALDVSSFDPTGDTIGLTLKVSDSSNSVSVSQLRLNGQPLSRQALSTDGNGGRVAITVSESSIADGFVLTGETTFDWTGSLPSGANMQLNFEIERQP